MNNVVLYAMVGALCGLSLVLHLGRLPYIEQRITALEQKVKDGK